MLQGGKWPRARGREAPLDNRREALVDRELSEALTGRTLMDYVVSSKEKLISNEGHSVSLPQPAI